MRDLSDDQKEIGVHIIGNLDEDGYLKTSFEEISMVTGYTEEEVTEVLHVIQNFDPVGIAARDLRECLLIQVRSQGMGDTVVEKILLDLMDKLENRKYDQIARSLSVPLEDVLNAVSVIRNLEPKPGRKFNNERTLYITPDVYVFKVGNDYQIVLNEDGLPKLRINQYYRQILSDRNKLGNGTREYILNKLKSAEWLIKSIHQRQRTIYRVTDSIVHFQRDFLDHGITHLKPLVLRDVAEKIEMHESTVSRATTNKYVHTPQGIFELKFFFNSGINRTDGDAVASESVKQHIRNIIKSEDTAKPYGDQAITDILKEMNIRVARRTVAKYRESMGIPTSRQRRNPHHHSTLS
jgi:RNA polymerase sigma-54 factor